MGKNNPRKAKGQLKEGSINGEMYDAINESNKIEFIINKQVFISFLIFYFLGRG